MHFAMQWAMMYDIVAVQEHRPHREGVSALGQHSTALSYDTSRGLLGCAVLWTEEKWELLMHESAGPRATMMVPRRRRRAIAAVSLHLPTQAASDAERGEALSSASILRAKVRRMGHAFFAGDMHWKVSLGSCCAALTSSRTT